MNEFEDANKVELEAYGALRTVIDPELAVNIIDLGLIYEISYSVTEGIHILMTLSSKGCPMGDVIMDAMRTVLNEKIPGVKVNIELTWVPAWTTDRVTANGKKELGLI
jgi:metal-sulfur cluster biosynthetic enzyme